MSVTGTSSFRVKVQPRGVFLVHAKGVRNGRQFDLSATGRKISPDAFARRSSRRFVHWCLLRWCLPDASSGGDFVESSRSISDRRDDSNSQTEKEKGRINLENCRNGSKARHCTCTRAVAGFRRRAGTDRPSGREKGRARPERCLDATKSKTSVNNRTGASCGRAGSSPRACRKETSIEKTAATCCATGGDDHFGARPDIALGGTIHGNHRAVA